MYVWQYGTQLKYEFDVQNKVSISWLLSLGPSLGIVRVRGLGLIHIELVSGIPTIFSHFVTNLPAFHQVLVFLCVKFVPVPHVRPEERFLVGRMGPKEYRLYRCIAPYGYRHMHLDDVEFEKDLVCSIAEFIRSERQVCIEEVDDDLAYDQKMTVVGTWSRYFEGTRMCEEDANMSEIAGTSEFTEIESPKIPSKRVTFLIPESPHIDQSARELQDLMEAREAGIAFILGHCYVKAKRGSSLMKKAVINVGYDFLRRSTLEVGMIYHV